MSLLLTFVFLLIALLLGQRNELYYLLFPFALTQGRGVFIEPNIFTFSGFSFYSDLIFFSFFIIAIITYKGQKIKIEKLFIIYAFYLVFLLAYSLITSDNKFRVFTIARIFLYLPISYYLLTRIISSVSKIKFIKFLRLIFIISIISSIAYILNSSNIISIFPQKYQVITYKGDVFVRDFSSIPIFLHYVTIIALISFSKKMIPVNKTLILFALFAFLLTYFFTFTRGNVLTLLMYSIFIIFGLFFKGKMKWELILLPIVIFVFYSFSQSFFSEEFGFFNTRFEEIFEQREETGNLLSRIELHERATQITKQENVFLGVGFSQKYMDYFNRLNGAWMGDTMWPAFILFTGFAGVAILAATLFYFLANSFYLFLKKGNMLFLASFAVILAYLLTGINGPGFNNRTLFPILFLAIFTVEKHNLWRKKRKKIRNGKN